jgi:hypothetical protein
MRFVNETPLHAAMIPNAEEDDRMLVLFLCAITYRISPRGGLTVAPRQRPLALQQQDRHPNDAMFTKTAASVCATGYVYADGSGARQALARLCVGAAEHAVIAFGARVWQPSTRSGGLSPSRPRRFDRVAMTWTHAFGGMVEEPACVRAIDGESIYFPRQWVGFPMNYEGTGYYANAREARYQPLPQLEHVAQRIQRWDDRPEPACFAPYPLWGGLRSEFVWRGGELQISGMGKLPSRAAPRTTFDSIAPGSLVALTGMRPNGEALAWRLPEAPASVAVSQGSTMQRLGLEVDAIDIDAEASEARVVYRGKLTYDLIRFQLRSARLEPTAALLDAAPRRGTHGAELS